MNIYIYIYIYIYIFIFQAFNSLLVVYMQGSTLINSFNGYTGSHTIGQARCVTFRDRIYDNGTDIDTTLLVPGDAVVLLIMECDVILHVP